MKAKYKEFSVRLLLICSASNLLSENTDIVGANSHFYEFWELPDISIYYESWIGNKPTLLLGDMTTLLDLGNPYGKDMTESCLAGYLHLTDHTVLAELSEKLSNLTLNTMLKSGIILSAQASVPVQTTQVSSAGTLLQIRGVTDVYLKTKAQDDKQGGTESQKWTKYHLKPGDHSNLTPKRMKLHIYI